MNKRCIVNVATGEFYCKMQERLMLSMINSIDRIFVNSFSAPDHQRSVFEKSRGIDLLIWKNVLPEGSRPHSESPYGFKVHAIKAAYERGYTSILWVDSPAYAVKEDISPIFEKIEGEGYYVMSHVDPIENYVSDTVLSQFQLLTREDLKGKNLPSGSCYGFDLSHTIGRTIYERLRGCEKNGHFNHMPPHRHDETILALLLIGGEKEIFLHDPLFQSDSPDCVIKSGG